MSIESVSIVRKSEQVSNLFAALAKAQSEIENPSKNKKNDHFKSMFADLAEVLSTARPVLSANGLAVSQWPSYESGVVHVTTILSHSSGEWMEGKASTKVTKDDPQGVGSAITYLRRFSLAAVAGIHQEDDDADSASDKGHEKITEQQAADLAAMVEEVGADLGAFCKYMKVAKLSDIQSATLQKAVTALEAKRKAATK